MVSPRAWTLAALATTLAAALEGGTPHAIRAHYSDRDTSWDDDWVGIVLDTFNDHRRAYDFIVNPVGVQMDFVESEVGGGVDRSWDAIWRSAPTAAPPTCCSSRRG